MHQYKPGGHDQFCLHDNTLEDAKKLMVWWQVPGDAMSLLNMNLMRKGPSYWERFPLL